MKKNKHVGSSLDDFLAREGILEEVEEAAAKRVFIYQFEKEMQKQKIDKAELADRMETSRSAVERILDPSSSSTLRTFANNRKSYRQARKDKSCVELYSLFWKLR